MELSTDEECEFDFDALEREEFIACFKRTEVECNLLFFCYICGQKLKGLSACENHWQKKKHKDDTLRKKKYREQVLVCPSLSVDRETSLNEFFETLYCDALTSDDLKMREEVCKRVEHCLRQSIQHELCCRLFGSSLTGVGFKNADINIDVQFDIEEEGDDGGEFLLGVNVDADAEDDESLDICIKVLDTNDTPAFFSTVLKIIQRKNETFVNVDDLLNEKSLIKFVDRESGLTCQLSPLFVKGFEFSDLVRRYRLADKRLLPLAILLRKWAKICEVDRPEMGSLPPYCFIIMLINYLQHTRPPVLPIISIPGFESTKYSGMDWEQEKYYNVDIERVSNWTSRNTSSVAALFVGFFWYFTMEFFKNSLVINIRQHAPLFRFQKGFQSRKLWIENPFQDRSNTANLLATPVKAYLFDSLMSTYMYFIGCTQLNGSLDHEAPSKKNDSFSLEGSNTEDLPSKLKSININVSGAVYTFKKRNFTTKTKVPLFCSECSMDGHGTPSCPTKIKEIVKLSEMTAEFLEIIDAVCLHVFEDFQMTMYEFNKRICILKITEDYLKHCFARNCRLTLFGSTVNGFGFKNSDMDISLRFKMDNAPVDLNCSQTVGMIASALRRNNIFGNITCIRSAKVPIVKFHVRDVECDISLYNCLAVANTSMLQCYAHIDCRAQILGICIKVFAKLCQIGDASRGSLSSYGYILLMIYYLQNCKPPVLPVLQEFLRPKNAVCKVEAYDAWFNTSLSEVQTRWSGYQQNQQSVGELWLGFFNFYLTDFSFNRHVVSIRQRKLLEKFEKSWNKRSLAIEDPFNLSHNIGGGIGKPMFEYIVNCFAQARLRFGTPINETQVNWNNYFFEPGFLTNRKKIPKERLCHKCGHIGHIAAKCVHAVRSPGVNNKSTNEEVQSRYTLLMHATAPMDQVNTTKKRNSMKKSEEKTPGKLADKNHENLKRNEVAKNASNKGNATDKCLTLKGNRRERLVDVNEDGKEGQNVKSQKDISAQFEQVVELNAPLGTSNGSRQPKGQKDVTAAKKNNENRKKSKQNHKEVLGEEEFPLLSKTIKNNKTKKHGRKQHTKDEKREPEKGVKPELVNSATLKIKKNYINVAAKENNGDLIVQKDSTKARTNESGARIKVMEAPEKHSGNAQFKRMRGNKRELTNHPANNKKFTFQGSVKEYEEVNVKKSQRVQPQDRD